MESMFPTSLTLLHRLRKANQPEAWERFVRLYAPLLLVWARRQGFQEPDAEDVVQEVLLKLIRALPEYRRGAGQSFRGWLFRLTINQCRDFRHRKATRALPGAHGLPDVSADTTLAEMEETEYRRRLVRRGLELIRTDFQETTWRAFTRVMVEGRGAPEVAVELNLTENAVYLARHRVLSGLRQELDGLLG